MNKLHTILLFIACWVGCANAYPATTLNDITKNLGGIGLNGLPQLSFDIVDRADAGELATLGFGFRLTHRTSLRSGRTAATEWLMPCLLTGVYIDGQGDIMWLTTSGQITRFRKNEQGYANSGYASAKVDTETGTVEITTRTSTTWRYKNGFLEAIISRGVVYAVETDHGTILSISRVVQDRKVSILKCAYYMQGDLQSLIFAKGRIYRFQWSADHSLLSIDGSEGRLFDFEYTDSLLTCWTKANSPRNELKWQYYLDNVRTTAFQTPPVLLREDASYEYRWDKGGIVDIVKVYNKDEDLLSETKIGDGGIEQTVADGTKYIFKRNP